MLSGFDERGQAIQIGAVLLFGVLVIAFAGYQAFVVPNQNKQVEFNHNQQVQQQLQDLRNGAVSIPGGGSGRSVSVQLGTQYPSRVVALNPGPPSGSLRTAGTTNPAVNFSVLNATTGGETGDFWNGDSRNYSSGSLVYEPNYNEYEGAPRTVYENTVLFNTDRGRNLTRTDQRLIDDRTISLVSLNGSLSVSQSSSVAVDLEAVSTSTRTVAVENASAGENVTVSVPTQLDENAWRDLLAPELVENGGYVYDISSEPIDGSQFRRLSIRLEPNVEYTLRLTRVGVGTGVREPSEAYLTTVSGNGSAVPEGSTQRLVVEVRDSFNNPVSGVTVNASTNLSSVRPSEDTTATDGRIAFTYQPPDDIDGGPKTVAVNVSTVVDPAAKTPFDSEAVSNATFSLTVQNTDGSGTGAGSGGGSSSVYSVLWENPDGDNPGAALSNCGPDSCEWDVGNSNDETLTIRGSTDPSVDGITLDFGVNDSSIGTISPGEGTTDSSGDATTELSAVSEGNVRAIVASGGSSDDINITLSNIEAALQYGNDAVAKDGPDGDDVAGGVEFTAANTFDQGMEIESIEVGSPTGRNTVLEDAVTPNDEPQRTEVYIAGDTVDGWVDRNGETDLPSTFDLDSDGFNNNNDNPESPSGGSFTFYLYEFEYDSGPNNNERIPMAGESFDVTVTYRLTGSGVTNSTTFTISP